MIILGAIHAYMSNSNRNTNWKALQKPHLNMGAINPPEKPVDSTPSDIGKYYLLVGLIHNMSIDLYSNTSSSNNIFQ